MLSPTENELITKVGPGTPMGNLLRRYWIPLVFDWEIPEPDCDPVSVRALGEDLVAFRDSDGRIGVLEAWCPHRLAHLFWGRNENNGLRCVHHGWKFDVTGQCVDMPSEPEQSNFKEKLRAQSYPAHELGNIVWIYMGPPGNIPPPPRFEFATVPETHRGFTKVIQECNWVQALDGGFDESHASFLHNNDLLDTTSPRARQRVVGIETETTDFGATTAFHRVIEDETPALDFLTLHHFVMPFVSIRASQQRMPEGPWRPLCAGHMWVPIDDEHTMVWNYHYVWGDEPLSEEERATPIPGNTFGIDIDRKTFKSVGNMSNQYLIDRSAQRTKSFTGVPGVNTQDRMIQDTMETITPRWREHLGTVDQALIAVRRLLLQQIRVVEDGGNPLATGEEFHGLRSIAGFLRAGTDWRDLKPWFRGEGPKEKPDPNY